MTEQTSIAVEDIAMFYNRINELHVLYSTDGFETFWEICINWTDCRELIHARMSVALSRYKRHAKS